MYGKTFTETSRTRFAARIIVSLAGIALALFFLIQVFFTPFFASQERLWMNVFYLVIAAMGALLFYWAAFTDFDRSKFERFFG